MNVAPFTGAWIEIFYTIKEHLIRKVAPFTGAWIEIILLQPVSHRLHVAPFTGAWIEILGSSSYCHHRCVAPFTGAWIEICTSKELMVRPSMSLPSRERGLKLERALAIEIAEGSLPSRERGLKYDISDLLMMTVPSRSLHGSVD